MTKIYECRTCGVISKARQQVCDPTELGNKHAYCGETHAREEMCHEMKEHLAYVCGSCGRPAEQADLLCDPLQTG